MIPSAGMNVISSWNVNSIRARFEHLSTWLQSNEPDIFALQETKVQDRDFPAEAIAALGYTSCFSGQRSYNGVAVLSRRPAVVFATEIPGFEDPQRRILAAEIDGLTVLNVYVPNGSSVGSEKYAYKLAWLDALHDWVSTLLQRRPRLIILGDFNIAPDDRDVYDPQAWQGKILCSDGERRCYRRLLELGMKDVFRRFDQGAGGFSWWDYRAGAFRRNHGLRIDLILAAAALAEDFESCTVDTEPRGWDRPSDHAPVTARLRT